MYYVESPHPFCSHLIRKLLPLFSWCHFNGWTFFQILPPFFYIHRNLKNDHFHISSIQPFFLTLKKKFQIMIKKIWLRVSSCRSCLVSVSFFECFILCVLFVVFFSSSLCVCVYHFVQKERWWESKQQQSEILNRYDYFLRIQMCVYKKPAAFIISQGWYRRRQ